MKTKLILTLLVGLTVGWQLARRTQIESNIGAFSTRGLERAGRDLRAELLPLVAGRPEDVRKLEELARLNDEVVRQLREVQAIAPMLK